LNWKTVLLDFLYQDERGWTREAKKECVGMWAGITETGLFSRSDTPPGGRQVITRRQRYTSGVLGFWLGWCGLILVIVVDSS